MCGIVGYVQTELNRNDATATIKAMADVMSHRPPAVLGGQVIDEVEPVFSEHGVKLLIEGHVCPDMLRMIAVDDVQGPDVVPP